MMELDHDWAETRAQLAAKDREIAALEEVRANSFAASVAASDRNAKLEREIAALREALSKIAMRNVTFPETNVPHYASMAVVTAREALSASPAPGPADICTDYSKSAFKAMIKAGTAPGPAETKPGCPRDDYPGFACIWPKCVILCPGRHFPPRAVPGCERENGPAEATTLDAMTELELSDRLDELLTPERAEAMPMRIVSTKADIAAHFAVEAMRAKATTLETREYENLMPPGKMWMWLLKDGDKTVDSQDGFWTEYEAISHGRCVQRNYTNSRAALKGNGE